MEKRTRTLLFSSFLAMFFIITPLIIGYSRGYRVEWESKQIVKIGALLLEPRPAPVELFIDGDFEKRSNFVFQNIYIDNLLPKTYAVETKKDGYHTWSKNLDIRPGLVTEVKNLLLFPITLISRELIFDLDVISIAPSKKHAIFVSSKTNDLSLPQVYLYDFDTKERELLFRASEPLRGFSVSEILWNKDSDSAIFTFKNRFALKKWLAVDINTGIVSPDIEREIRNNTDFTAHTETFAKISIDSVQWRQSGGARALFVARDISGTAKPIHGTLFEYDLREQKISEPLADDILGYTPSGEDVVYISSMENNLKFLNLPSKEARDLTFGSVNVTEPSNIKFINENVFMAGSGDLKEVFVYSADSKSLERIEGEFLNAVPSLDNKRLMLISRNSIYVYWMEDVHIQPFRDRGDLEEILKLENFDMIESAAWYSSTNEHIIFSNRDSINVIELDSRDKRNMHKVADYSADRLFYDDSRGILYLTSDKKLYEMLMR